MANQNATTEAERIIGVSTREWRTLRVPYDAELAQVLNDKSSSFGGDSDSGLTFTGPICGPGASRGEGPNQWAIRMAPKPGQA